MESSAKSGIIALLTFMPAIFLLNFVVPDSQNPEVPGNITKNPGFITVTSTGMNFDIQDEVPSGWNTFRYENLSPDAHFFVIQKLPEGKTIENTKAEVIPVFSKAMGFITAGNKEQGFAEFDKLPAWFYDVEFEGGPGLVSPGRTVETTINLEPGYYVIECYVKMPDGQFHSALGMIEDFNVMNKDSGLKQPTPDYEIKISSEKGIELPEDLAAGEKIFEVKFIDQKPHENFVGHDVHLVKLEADADQDKLNSWMNWSDPDGFISPAPGGVDFMGGTQEMKEGKKAYFSARLQPGTYALIAEVPDPKGKNMFQTFTIPKD